MSGGLDPDLELRLAGVIGQPIGHSLSPDMMAHWMMTSGLKASGIEAHYAPIEVAPDALADFLRVRAGEPEFAGFNITLPHKQAALALADEASETARAVGAANLLTFRDGKIFADNTDVAGFLTALEPADIPYDRTSTLVFGAGGVARAVVHALLTKDIAELVLCNRNRERAERLKAELAPQARIVDWEERQDALAAADLAVNATSLGLEGEPALELDWSRAKPGCVVFDSVYTPLETAFLAGARRQGLLAIDGLDMLIGQGRPSFTAFFGAPPAENPPVRGLLTALLETRP